MKRKFSLLLFTLALLLCQLGLTPTPLRAATKISANKYKSHVPVEEGFLITDYAVIFRRDFDYYVYKLEKEVAALEDEYPYEERYWVIVAVQNRRVFDVLMVEDAYSSPQPPISQMVLEYDVNFDGVNEVLIWLGHFGAQGLVLFDCYLKTDNKLVKCDSFRDICNPNIDNKKQELLGFIRNMAVSHSWTIFNVINGEFAPVKMITETLVYEEESDVWTWTVEEMVNGKWQVSEYFTENDYDDEALIGKIYDDNSEWGLSSDRWKSLYGMVKSYPPNMPRNAWANRPARGKPCEPYNETR